MLFLTYFYVTVYYIILYYIILYYIILYYIILYLLYYIHKKICGGEALRFTHTLQTITTEFFVFCYYKFLGC